MVEMMHETSQMFRMEVKKTNRPRFGDGGGAREEQKLEEVNLRGMGLKALPTSNLNLGLICKLDLSHNNLQDMPESLMARLLNLVVLDVQSNELTSLPNSVGCLTKLKIFNVSGNLLECLPKGIENCRSLEELNANFNQLKKLPDAIGFELVNLRKLSVNSNKLDYLPYSTSHLTNLRTLDARLNCLRALPEDLENLVNLQTLNISQNFQYFTTLPDSIGLLCSLVELDISYNKITVLPNSMGGLSQLQKFSVEGNPLVSPPMEIVEQSLDAMRGYLIDRMHRAHTGPVKKSWIGKFVKWGTFSGATRRDRRPRMDNDHGMPEYRSIDGMATPRYMGMFSPRRIFSPKSYYAP